MRHLVVTVLVLHPLEHLTASVVVEVGIDIGERDTVGIEETFEKQVVLDRVDLRDAQAVSHNRAGCRATTRTHHHAQLVLCRVDEVLHDEEVAREAHRLHNVQLELDALVHFVGERFAVESLRSVVGELG